MRCTKGSSWAEKISLTLRGRPTGRRYWAGKKMSLRHRENMSLARRSWLATHSISSDTRAKIAESKVGKSRPRYVIDAMRNANLGRKHSLLTRMKMSSANNGISLKLRKKMIAGLHSPEGHKNMSLAQIGRKHPPEVLKRMSKAQIHRWKSASTETRNSMLQKMCKTRANSLSFGNHLERKIAVILDRLYPGEFRLNNGEVAIGGKFPDFVGIKRKILLEVFGSYWHGQERTGLTKSQAESRRKSHFAKFGWHTAIIWGKSCRTRFDDVDIKAKVDYLMRRAVQRPS